jgi:glucan phosphoethanolaminetransferase (alkaline phosphatase superfamily)
MIVKIKNKLQHSGHWYSLFAISVLIAYFLVFMEWLFFVTKPSFMDGMGISQKVGILLAAGGILGTVSLVLIIGFFLVNLLSPSTSNTLLYGALLVPAVLLAFLALLLLDNFTYTVFKFGIVSTRGVIRGVYALLFFFAIVYFYRWALSFIKRKKSAAYRLFLFLSPLLLLIAGAVFLFGQFKLTPFQKNAALDTDKKNFPNILILGSDGVNASHTSAYGYDRDTTPYLRQLATQSLVAENAFTNAGNSSGSVASMLTGKLSTTTRVLYPPNILNGADAYQHLPGTLKRLGYFTAEIGLPKYVDAYELNMQDGFDLVNQHFINNDSFFQAGSNLRLGDISYFLYLIFDRVAERLQHIFYIRTMENSYKVVTEPDTELDIGDQQRVNQLIELITNTKQPLFVHVHLMGTHGPMFYPNQRTFSAGEEQKNKWQDDFYDDAILDFDGYVKDVFNVLSETGKLDNTIVVIYTDHNQQYQTTQRIPLMFYFPAGSHAGRIHNNVQNADISPTLLDYLEVPIPEWMIGQSLLKGEPPQNRLIFSASAAQVDPENYEPPFYQFGALGVVACDRWYQYYVRTNLILTGPVSNHTSPCSQADELAPDAFRTSLLKQLQEANFQVTTLPEDVYETLPYGRVTRAQAAILILKRLRGSAYDPPPAAGLFGDVPPSHPYAAWVEQTYNENLLDACSDAPLEFCPDDELTLDEAARLALRVKNGESYSPPSLAAGSSNDSCSSPASPWVEELETQGVLAGCSDDPQTCCPETPMTIGPLFTFLVSAQKAP